MPTSSRFAVAVHILAGLAHHKGVALTSETIARSASTNAAVIRRLMSTLNKAGFTRSQLGQGGGALLAKPAEAIRLVDVYRAVETDALFALHRTRPDQDCLVGRQIQPVLQLTIDKAVRAMEAELAEVTIADVVRKMVRRDRAQ